jgi:hypothetical protein
MGIKLRQLKETDALILLNHDVHSKIYQTNLRDKIFSQLDQDFRSP